MSLAAGDCRPTVADLTPCRIASGSFVRRPYVCGCVSSQMGGKCTMTSAGETAPGMPRLHPERLRTRAEFVRAGRGARQYSDTLAIHFAANARAGIEPPRFGFTVTKKTGNSVERNRIRRRLREALRHATALEAMGGGDYVIVARREAISRDFAALIGDLERAVRQANRKANLKAGTRANAGPTQPGKSAGTDLELRRDGQVTAR